MSDSVVNSSDSPITVIIVDDHPIMREGLVRLFEFADGINVIGQASNGEDAIRLVRELRPQVILLDINLPTINGLEVTSQLRSEFRQTVAIVLLTAHDDQEQIIHAMRSGASAYCTKEIETEKLIETIRVVARGGFMIHGKPFTQRALNEWLEERTGALTSPFNADSGDHLVPLTSREMEILRCVTRGLSNKEIAAELGISHQTVKNHMTNVLDKLSVEDRTQAAVLALKRGWVRVINTSQPKDD